MNSSFFNQSADRLARQLLGYNFHFNKTISRIVETEAYLGKGDLACHAAKKKTKRNEVMFHEGGVFYIYLIYGIYHMLNVVSGPEGSGEAVLIRALEPLNYQGNTDGPGKLTRRLEIDKSLNAKPVESYFSKAQKPKKIITCPRIGINYAGESKDLPLRFYIQDNPYVSKVYNG